MSLKVYNPLILIFTILLFMSCSDSSTNSPDSEEKSNLEFKITTENAQSARPGGFAIFSSHVNRIAKDSLTGVKVTWETKNEGIKLERQSPNTVAAFIPSDFAENKLTITANIVKASNNLIANRNSKSKSIDIKDDPLSTEPLKGFITSDTTLDKEKVYQLTKDISLKDGAVLTIKNGATLDLNGHAILSKNGVLNLEGTDEKKVKLIVGKNTYERIQPKFKAQFAQILSSNNAAGILVLGKATIKDSEIYGHFVVNNCSISNSKISKLTPTDIGRSLGPYSIEINNSTIYQLYIDRDKINEGANLDGQNNIIFILDFHFPYNNSNINGLSINFTDNNISYLNISGKHNDGQTIFKNNDISRLLINGNFSSSIHQNNIGILQDGFYEKDEEPFWAPSWGESFKKLNGPTVKMNTSGQFEVQEFDLSNNYWSPEILKEMNAKGSGKDISFIYDYYDDSSIDKIIYKNWSETKF